MTELANYGLDRTAKRRAFPKVVRTWQLQEAKAQLCHLVRLARTEGPQQITRRGKSVAVVIPVEQYEAMLASSCRSRGIVQFFANSPLVGVELNLSRDKDRR